MITAVQAKALTQENSVVNKEQIVIELKAIFAEIRKRAKTGHSNSNVFFKDKTDCPTRNKIITKITDQGFTIQEKVEKKADGSLVGLIISWG